jgi:hypothetical protein
MALLELLRTTLLSGKSFPDKEQVFRKIFKRETFDDHRVRMAMTALLHITEKYLTIRDFLQEKPAYQLRLSKVIRNRSLPAQANTAWLNGQNTRKPCSRLRPKPFN